MYFVKHMGGAVQVVARQAQLGGQMLQTAAPNLLEPCACVEHVQGGLGAGLDMLITHQPWLTSMVTEWQLTHLSGPKVVMRSSMTALAVGGSHPSFM